jgi:acetyl esterase/lipase
MPQDLTPIHPDLRALYRRFPRMSYSRWLLPLIRGAMYLLPGQKPVDDVDVRQIRIPNGGAGREMLLRIYRPRTAQAVPVMVWMHGGGLVIGHPRMADGYALRFVREAGVAVVSVDYRLAPNHPYPAAIEDCYTALRWVQAHAGQMGFDPNRIAVGGESAGGGLAAGLAQMAHDRREVPVVFQMLIYPMLDDRSALRTDLPHTQLMTWTPQNNRFGWEAYLGQAVGLDDVPPYSVPARRQDLSGLPPAWIGVGTLDLFFDEDCAYAETLRRSGVDCTLVTVEGAFHGFDVFDIAAEPVQAFRDAVVGAVKQALSKPV